MTTRNYDYMVYIGRFQPPHEAHIETIQTALEQAEQVIILVGSAFRPRTIKNPWKWDEREQMMRSCFPERVQSRLNFVPIEDVMYNDQQWVRNVQEGVDEQIRLDGNLPENVKTGLIGYHKDGSSYYIELFPQWELYEMPNINDLNATDIRNAYFEHEQFTDYKEYLPEPIFHYLLEFTYYEAEEYQRLVREYDHVKKYKQAWEAAPYPPTFVTVDAVVIQSGHILLVTRKAQPGEGLYALPGGFIDQNERIEDSMIRELREETKLKVPDPVLRGNIVTTAVFDAPERSTRGRTITHASLIELPAGKLPKVKGGDDAAKAFWVPLKDVEAQAEMFFEDHKYIIEYFLGHI